MRNPRDIWVGLATSVRLVRGDRKEPGPTEADTGRNSFEPSPGCGRSGRYRVAHGMEALIPNKTMHQICDAIEMCAGTNVLHNRSGRADTQRVWVRLQPISRVGGCYYARPQGGGGLSTSAAPTSRSLRCRAGRACAPCLRRCCVAPSTGLPTAVARAPTIASRPSGTNTQRRPGPSGYGTS